LLSTGCGSAEAFKVYNYATTKDNLEKALMKAIKSNPNIYLDTTKATVRVLRHPEVPGDTSTEMISPAQYHGRDSAMLAAYDKANYRIKIKKGLIENEYGFHYMGDEQYWKASASSAILLSYVRDKYGNEVEQGHNERGQFKTRKAKEFTELFEAELVSRIDNELQLSHTSD
jgi:hypothetical protein